MTPLRRRMIDDMALRNLSPHTVQAYVRAVAQFAKHFGRSPALLSGEDARQYLLHLGAGAACELEPLQPGALRLAVLLPDHPRAGRTLRQAALRPHAQAAAGRARAAAASPLDRLYAQQEQSPTS